MHGGHGDVDDQTYSSSSDLLSRILWSRSKKQSGVGENTSSRFFLTQIPNTELRHPASTHIVTSASSNAVSSTAPNSRIIFDSSSRPYVGESRGNRMKFVISLTVALVWFGLWSAQFRWFDQVSSACVFLLVSFFLRFPKSLNFIADRSTV